MIQPIRYHYHSSLHLDSLFSLTPPYTLSIFCNWAFPTSFGHLPGQQNTTTKRHLIITSRIIYTAEWRRNIDRLASNRGRSHLERNHRRPPQINLSIGMRRQQPRFPTKEKNHKAPRTVQRDQTTPREQLNHKAHCHPFTYIHLRSIQSPLLSMLKWEE